MKQLAIPFNRQKAEKRRDDALSRLKRHESSPWFERGLQVIREARHAGYREMLSEDIIRWIGPPPEGMDPRVLGALMREAEARGLLTPTDRFRAGSRVSRHGAPCRIWRIVASAEAAGGLPDHETEKPCPATGGDNWASGERLWQGR